MFFFITFKKWLHSKTFILYLIICAVCTFIGSYHYNHHTILSSIISVLMVLLILFIKLILTIITTMKKSPFRMSSIKLPLVIVFLIALREWIDYLRVQYSQTHSLNDLNFLEKSLFYFYDKDYLWESIAQRFFFILLFLFLVRLITNKETAKIDFRITGILAMIVLSLFALIDLTKGFDQFKNQNVMVITLYFFMIALTEEIIFRRFLTGSLLKIIKKPIVAIVLSGILFGLAHVPHPNITSSEMLKQTMIYLTETTINGIIWSYLYYKTKSIFPSTVIHTISNLF